MTTPHHISLESLPQEILPHLPPELERHIFELAAYQSIGCARNLLLVAKRVQEWIQPILYDTIVIEDGDWDQKDPPSHDRLEFPKKKPKIDLVPTQAVHVHHLLLSTENNNTITSAIQACINVNSLLMQSSKAWSYSSLVHMQYLTKLQRLTTKIGNPCDGRAGCLSNHFMKLTTITHLHLFSFGDWEHWTTHVALPNLTHLALSYSTPKLIEEVLQTWPRLKLVVVFYEDGSDLQFLHTLDRWSSAKLRKTVDHKVVSMPSLGNWDAVKADWENGVRGLEDFWTKAEEIQAETRPSTDWKKMIRQNLTTGRRRRAQHADRSSEAGNGHN